MDSSFHKITTHQGYSRHLQPYMGGRRFALGGVGLQRSLRCVRAILCGGTKKRDKDLRKAHLWMGYGLFEKVVADVAYAKFKAMPTYAELLKTPQKYVDMVIAALKCDEKQAKTLLLGRLNGCHLGRWLAKEGLKGTLPRDVMNLFGEFDTVRDVLIQSRPDILSAARAAGRERPELTAFSYLLCEEEDRALQIMEDHLF